MSKIKPTSLKLLEGNRGKRKLNLDEPKPEAGASKCPSWLIGEAKKEWKRVIPELDKLGLLTIVDGAALACYCQSWGRYVDAEKYLKKQKGMVFETDKGYQGMDPHVSIALKYSNLCRAFMIEFGLTPSARGRMSLPSGKQDESPMAKLWKQKRA